jgi:phosphate-selective porin OprO/OprP
MTRISPTPVLALLLLLPPAAALAQTAPPAPPPQTTAGFDNGFFIQSGNGDNRLVLGLLTQIDGRFSLDDPAPVTGTFLVRKIRPILSGRIARYFEFKVMPDFGNGTAVIQDAYFDTRFATALRLRVGKDKTPVGYELLMGDSYLYFPERALASSLVPSRDVGVQLIGDVAGGKLSYSGGVFNGVADAASSTSDVDSNSAKDLAGRVTVQPFRSARQPARAFTGLGFHLGGSTGTEASALPSYRTSAGQNYFSYAAGAAANGTRTRVTPAVFYYYRSFGGFAEYMRSTQEVSRSGITRDISNDAWEVSGSYVLTGEAASERGIRPRNAFDPANHHWGALQLLARYSALQVDAAAFSGNLAAAGASHKAQQWTAAVNWYPASFIKWYGTFERTVFDGDASGPRRAEDVILFRAQLAF